MNRKDSLVYVDLWASWCAPCINDMPLVQKLKAQLSAEKIAIVYFSIDENVLSWKNKSKDLGLLTNNYLLIKNVNSKLSKEIKLTAIPRFLLFKNGELIYANAYPPNNPLLVNYLKLESTKEIIKYK